MVGRHRRRRHRADADLAEHSRRRSALSAAIGEGRSPCASATTAGVSILTSCSTPWGRARGPSSSTRRAIRPAGLQRHRRASRLSSPSLANAASGSSPTRFIIVLLRWRPRSPSFYDVADPEDPILYVQYLLEELGDDRLARQLDLGAAAARPGQLEYDPVLDHGSFRVHPTRRVRWGSTRARISSSMQREQRPRQPRNHLQWPRRHRPRPFPPSRPALSTCFAPSTASLTRKSSSTPAGRRSQSRHPRPATPSAMPGPPPASLLPAQPGANRRGDGAPRGLAPAQLTCQRPTPFSYGKSTRRRLVRSAPLSHGVGTSRI